ncbi:hypothetical protein [Kitasatospora sp. NBC_01302]|nr:hypothetical protein OG294_10470 [Kitasatospora sp. NBC_01302]
MRPKITAHILESGSCPAGGDHQYQMWSAKMRCVKCGATLG